MEENQCGNQETEIRLHEDIGIGLNLGRMVRPDSGVKKRAFQVVRTAQQQHKGGDEFGL